MHLLKIPFNVNCNFTAKLYFGILQCNFPKYLIELSLPTIRHVLICFDRHVPMAIIIE